MRVNFFILGVLLGIMGVIMYLSVTPSLSHAVLTAFQGSQVASAVLSHGNTLATTATASVESLFKVTFSTNDTAIFFLVLGIILMLVSEEDRFEKIKREGDEAHKAERIRTRNQAIMVELKSIPSILISWFILVFVFYIGLPDFWYAAIAIIYAYVITSYLVELTNRPGAKHVAFMIYFVFIIISALMASALGSLFLNLAEQQLSSLPYVMLASIIAVLASYYSFHAQHYKGQKRGEGERPTQEKQ